ncbi:hypothetical protein [Lactiplantibacillus plantarum]|nr:hypothetical protein [Lactiplantibacillus plantarum]EMP44060.1 putative transposase [Lactiplantibacillus plantarum UCMA 3037]EPD24740.1 putative transposase [Lactiplantibacillus plantarum IPLA88]AGO07433.1 transposase [Lactiplantibacillus plantarum 16]AMR18891.1 transposase [Lactiplantibacillus plantarum]ANI95579.1 transposase [Lactiplantibacillus plantarum]
MAQHEVLVACHDQERHMITHQWNDFKLRWMDRHAKPATYKELVALVEEGSNYFNQLDRSSARNDLTPAEYWNEAV